MRQLKQAAFIGSVILLVNFTFHIIEFYFTNNHRKIVYDEDKVRSLINHLHDTNYKVRNNDHCRKHVPDCMIVGVGKSGTRELIDFMSIHPNIISKFDPYQYKPDRFTNLTDHFSIKMEMPCRYSDQVSVVKADTFLVEQFIPLQLYILNPHIKLIVIVREPVSRLLSDLTFFAKKSSRRTVIEDSMTMKKFIQNLLSNPDESPILQVRKSMYSVGLKEYMDVFPRDQLLILESKEFVNNPAIVLKEIERFLGLRSFFSDEYFVFNPKSNFTCLRDLESPPGSMVCYGTDRGRKMSIEVSDEDKLALTNYFRPYNEELFKLIGRRFDW